jgi:hypothetical protein
MTGRRWWLFARGPSVLARHLAAGGSLGALAAAGTDPEAAIAAEADAAVLMQALARAQAAGDGARVRACQWRLLAVLPPADPRRRSAALALAQARAWAGDAAGAAALRPAGPPADPAEAIAMARLAAASDDRAAVQDAIAAAETRWPGPEGGGVWAWAQAVTAHLQGGRPAAAQALLDSAPAAFAPRLAAERVQVVAALQGPEAALDALAAETGLSPAQRRVLTARLDLARGRFEVVFDRMARGLADDPADRVMLALATLAAWQCDRSVEFGPLLDAAIAANPEAADLLAARAQHRASLGETEAAAADLAELDRAAPWEAASLRMTLALQAGPAGGAGDALAAALAAGVPPPAPQLAYGNHVYYFAATPEALTRALQVIEPLGTSMAGDAGYQRLRLRLLIALGQADRAAAAFAALPAGLQADAALEPFALWDLARQGRDAAAQAGWSRHLARTAPIALSAREAWPTTRALRWTGRPGDILVFLTVYNGAPFLPWFLDHYRRLGADHVFVIDNASTDETAAICLAQPDVSLFDAPGSFRRAGCGVFWANDLMRRFGPGHWCLHVDMDEAFVFPGQERGATLRDLLAFCEARGAASVPALMLDIYPPDLDAADPADPFAASTLIDRDYTAVPCEIPPYSMIQGGLRARMTGRSLLMTKAPLVRMTADTAFLTNNHHHSHLPLSPVTGALLHYKFVGDIRGRVSEAIARNEHFMGARFYRALQDPLARDGRLASANSVAWRDPGQLVELGLATSHPDWEAWPLGRTRAAMAQTTQP